MSACSVYCTQTKTTQTKATDHRSSEPPYSLLCPLNPSQGISLWGFTITWILLLITLSGQHKYTTHTHTDYYTLPISPTHFSAIVPGALNRQRTLVRSWPTRTSFVTEDEQWWSWIFNYGTEIKTYRRKNRDTHTHTLLVVCHAADPHDCHYAVE